MEPQTSKVYDDVENDNDDNDDEDGISTHKAEEAFVGLLSPYSMFIRGTVVIFQQCSCSVEGGGLNVRTVMSHSSINT